MIIGKNSETKENVKIDLNNLIISRLLIQANAGGGKSWLLRKILEESHGKVQQIILDIEGEFVTLRERYDYLLCGRDGDIPVNIKTASLLAKKILELNVSSIIDISELKKHERILFVQRFLDSLMEVPRKLWHPCLVVVDEAHQFCPQASKSDSASSVIDLMTRGRKRGFCGILATQRISKLHKDACAETNNRLIGRTGLDIDRKRASEELGFTSKEDERSLRLLEPGEFYAFGSSISKEIIKMKVSDVKTSHPEAGSTIIQPSKTPENIKKILKDVIDLPKEVEEELKTKQDMQKRISELKRDIRVLESSKGKPEIDYNSLNKAKEEGFLQGSKETESRYIKIMKENEKVTNSLLKQHAQMGEVLGRIGHVTQIKMTPIKEEILFKENEKLIEKPVTNRIQNVTTKIPMENIGNGSLRAGAMKMLNWLAGAYPSSLTKQRIATLSGFSVKGGTFNTYISELKRNGWIVGANELSITEDGLKNATPSEIPSGEELLELWCTKFRQGAGNILRIVYSKYPNEISKEDIGYETGFESSGGTFNTYLSELRRNGLIKIEGGQVSINPEFFE